MPRVNDLFDVRYGHSLELNRLKRSKSADAIAFVSRKMGDNGIAAYVAPVKGQVAGEPGELTCALSGNGVLSTFVQDWPFYTGFHVAILRPKVAMSKALLLFYCACLEANRFRFSWGRQANRTLKDILVPSIDEAPDWVPAAAPDQFDGLNRPVREQAPPALDGRRWKLFRLGSLFEIKKGKRLTKPNRRDGKVPFIGAIDHNNGVTQLIDGVPAHPAGTITVNYNGNGVAEAFFQPVPFMCSDDVNILYPRFQLTPMVAMFLNTVIRIEKYRFSYGRKWHAARMRESGIRLPAKEDGTPDWVFMESYIESLPFSSQV